MVRLVLAAELVIDGAVTGAGFGPLYILILQLTVLTAPFLTSCDALA